MKNLLYWLLGISLATLWILNFFVGIVGGVWLIATGNLWFVVIAVIASFVMPYVYTIAMFPTMLFLPVIEKVTDNGNRALSAIVYFVLAGYNNLLLLFWVGYIFEFLVDNDLPLLPTLLFGYAVAMGPIGYMAKAEDPKAGTGTVFGVLFVQLSYIILSINLLIGVDLVAGYGWVWLLWLVYTIATTSIGISYVKRKDKKKILVIEDEKFLLDLFTEILTDEGYEVTSALDGEIGLNLMNSYKYDLVSTGIVLPKIDGIEILKRFKPKRNTQGKIIVVTNIGPELLKGESKMLGIDGWFNKSDLTPDHYKKIVKIYLSNKSRKEVENDVEKVLKKKPATHKPLMYLLRSYISGIGKDLYIISMSINYLSGTTFCTGTIRNKTKYKATDIIYIVNFFKDKRRTQLWFTRKLKLPDVEAKKELDFNVVVKTPEEGDLWYLGHLESYNLLSK